MTGTIRIEPIAFYVSMLAESRRLPPASMGEGSSGRERSPRQGFSPALGPARVDIRPGGV